MGRTIKILGISEVVSMSTHKSGCYTNYKPNIKNHQMATMPGTLLYLIHRAGSRTKKKRQWWLIIIIVQYSLQYFNTKLILAGFLLSNQKPTFSDVFNIERRVQEYQILSLNKGAPMHVGHGVYNKAFASEEKSMILRHRHRDGDFNINFADDKNLPLLEFIKNEFGLNTSNDRNLSTTKYKTTIDLYKIFE
ncbi:Uncharacterized protein FWK35_00002667 [Aphis craccivora]|uniref:Uncharacterized protein n=1 Tax=Aphis craccivora TaxID=307492 RepID=A0A6G0Z2I1_APHCR|nr:Uncharacterized protein FWK35_00002667 [Aphis craccivora]